MTKGTKKRFLWSNLFYNNRFVLVFSVFASFIIWVVLMYSKTDENAQWKIDNVPIRVVYSAAATEAGLKAYNLSKNVASVSITGSTLIIRQIQADNIEVVATVTEDMRDPQNNTLMLTAEKKQGVLADFRVASISPDTITAEVDVAREQTFPLQNEITVPEPEGDSNYFVKQPSFSAETVTVSGPDAFVKTIHQIAARYTFSEPLTETRDFTAELVMYNEKGEEITNDYVSLSPATVDVRLPVLWLESVPVEMLFTDRPDSFPDRLITVEPKQIDFAGAREAFEKFTSIVLEPIHFSEINLMNYEFDIPITTPEGFENIADISTARVSFDLTGYSQKEITINKSDITPFNVPTDREAEVNENITVTVIGPSSDVAKLTEQNLYAQINMAGQDAIGIKQLPVTISILRNTSCWVLGNEHTAIVTVGQKTQDVSGT